jgi:hypothetical protein
MSGYEFVLHPPCRICLEELKDRPDIEIIDFSNFKHTHDDPGLEGKRVGWLQKKKGGYSALFLL